MVVGGVVLISSGTGWPTTKPSLVEVQPRKCQPVGGVPSFQSKVAPGNLRPLSGVWSAGRAIGVLLTVSMFAFG